MRCTRRHFDAVHAASIALNAVSNAEGKPPGHPEYMNRQQMHNIARRALAELDWLHHEIRKEAQ